MMAWWWCAVLVIVIAMVVVRQFVKQEERVPASVRIRVNAERTLEVPTGHALLYTLENAGITLPTSCGGTGTCAKCQCRVPKGGGRITDRELPYFSGSQVKDHWRLACQVIVVRDLEVEVPASLLHPPAPDKVS